MILMKIDFLFVLFNIIFQMNTVFGAWKNYKNVYPFEVKTKGGMNYETGEMIEQIAVKLRKYKGIKLLIFNISVYQLKDNYYTDLLKLAQMATSNNFKMLALENCNFNYILYPEFNELSASSNDINLINPISTSELQEYGIDLYFCKRNLTCENSLRLWKYLKDKTKSNIIQNGQKIIDVTDDKLNIQGNYTIFIINEKGIPTCRFDPGWELNQIMEVLNVKIRPTDNEASSSTSFRLFGETINIPK